MLAQAIVNSLVLSVSLFLVASGLSIVYGILTVINFAHGEIYMAGAFMFWVFSMQLGLNAYIATIMSVLSTIALAALIQIGPFNIVRKNKNPVMGFIVCLGLQYVLQTVFGSIFGLQPKTVKSFPGFTKTFNIGNIAIGGQRFLIIIIGIIVIVALLMFMKYHKWGKAFLALAQNPEAAELQGISVYKGSLYAMIIGGALAGLAGCLIAPISYVEPYMGASYIMRSFSVIIIGGLGSLPGTIIASFIWGFVEGFSGTYFDTTIGFMLMYIFVIVLIILRPTGIMGRKVD